MELSYNELRKKEVVNTLDGRKMGRVCDLIFCYPENRVLGIVVPSGRGLGLKREEYFIDLKNIVKIGEDVILVNIGLKCRPVKAQGGNGGVGGMGGNGGVGGNGGGESRRSFEEYE